MQLARAAGAHVTGVADAARAPFVRELGAHEVVDRARQDVLSLGERWDVVLDAPFRLIVPFDYGFAEAIRASSLPQTIA